MRICCTRAMEDCMSSAAFFGRQDRADYYARKGIQVRQAVTL